MKKALLILVAVIGLSVSVFAGSVVRCSVCNRDGQRIELYKDGTCVFKDYDGRGYDGRYEISNVGGSLMITMSFQDRNLRTLRGDIRIIYPDSSQQEVYITIDGESFSRGNCR